MTKTIYILHGTARDLWEHSIYAVSHDQERILEIAKQLIDNHENLIETAKALDLINYQDNTVYTGLDLIETNNETTFPNSDIDYLGQDGEEIYIEPKTKLLIIHD